MNKIKYFPTMPINEVIRYASQDALEGPQYEIIREVVRYYEERVREAVDDMERSSSGWYEDGCENGYENGKADGYEIGRKEAVICLGDMMETTF